MIKEELIEKVAEECDETKILALKNFNAIFNIIKQCLRNHESIMIQSFGTFKTVLRQAREGRNPRTGEKLHIPAKNVPVFRASKSLNDICKN